MKQMKEIKKHDLVLVKLNRKQIKKAKESNRSKQVITHALLCGPYGQLFGDEEYCLRYYSVWLEVFPLLFARRRKTKRAKIQDYHTTFDLVNDLISVQDAFAKHYGVKPPPPKFKKRSGCLTSLLPFY